MTEAEWLSARADPEAMLNFLHGRASDRQLRLCAVHCCRRVRDLHADERLLVDGAERYAEGPLNSREKAALRKSVAAVAAGNTRMFAAAAAGTNAWMGAVFGSHWLLYGCHPLEEAAGQRDRKGIRFVRHLLRDLFGPLLFRSVSVDAAWRNNGTVVKLAQAIYDERAFDRMPILADALEDASCTNQDILAHCRGSGEHVRGCWAVDLLLGRS